MVVGSDKLLMDIHDKLACDALTASDLVRAPGIIIDDDGYDARLSDLQEQFVKKLKQ